MTFASPGLSYTGSFSKSKTTTTTTTASLTGSGCDATGLNETIKSKATKCTGTDTPVTGCTKKEYSYDTAAGYVNGGTTDLVTALKKGINTTDHGTAVNLEVKAAGSIIGSKNGACGSESGSSSPAR